MHANRGHRRARTAWTLRRAGAGTAHRARARHRRRRVDPVDLRDLDALRTALRDIEVVVHLGGIDRSFITDDAATMQVNAMGTWNLFEASLQVGVRRVIHCSSSSVLGLDTSNPHMPPCYLPIDEAHPARATDAYGLSKVCGERIAEAYSRRGLEVIVIRPCFVAFPEMADFMVGKPGPEGRAEPMPLPAHLCRAGGLCARLRRRGDGRLSWLRDVLPGRRRRVRNRADRGAGSKRCTVRRSRCATRPSTNAPREPRRSATPRRTGASAGHRRRAGRPVQSRVDYRRTAWGSVT